MNIVINLPREARLGSVDIDGKRIDGVTRVVVLADVSGATKVRLSLLPNLLRLTATDPDLIERTERT